MKHLDFFFNAYFCFPLLHVPQHALTCMGHVQDQLTKNKLNHKITLQSPSAKPPSGLSSLSCDPEAAYIPHDMTCFAKVSHVNTSKKPKTSVYFRLAWCFTSPLYQRLTGGAPQEVVTKFWVTRLWQSCLCFSGQPSD